MRPVLDRDFFPGLPKFLWFDDGSSSDGGGGTGAPGGDAATTGGGTGATTGVGTGAAPGTSATSADAAAAGIGGVGSAGQADAVGGSSDAASAFGGGGGQTSVTVGPSQGNAGVTDAAAQGMAFGGGGTAARGGAATGGGGGGGGPGAATGGGAGTAAGGSGFGAVRGMNPAVVNSIIAASLMGVPRGYATGAPAVSPPMQPGQGKMTLRAGPQSLSDLAGLASSPATGVPSSGSVGPNLGPAQVATLNAELAGLRGGMGFPAAGLAHTPTGGYTSSLGAPRGSTIGQATINAPPTNPNAPAVGSQNAATGLGAGGIGSDAVAGGSSPNAPPGTPSDTGVPGLSPQDQALMDQIHAATVQDALNYAGAKFGPPQTEGQPRAFSNSPPEAFTMPNASPQQPLSPTNISLFQLIQSLASGGAPGPGLSSLAQTASPGGI